MEQPLLLIISRNDGQNAYLTHAFGKLTPKYILVFYDADTVTSPFIRAKEILEDLKLKNITPNGVFGFLDNDVSIAAIIADQLKLPGTSLRSIYTAQNKEVFAKLLRIHKLPFPATRTITIDNNHIPHLKYPVFIRPVKGSFSADSYMIRSVEEYSEKTHLLSIKKNIVAKAYKDLFLFYDSRYSQLEQLFIVQEFITAKQYNVDGFVHNKKIYILGITESIYTPDRKSFKRFDFPHKLPQRIFKKLIQILQKLTTLINYDNSSFNLEFFITVEKNIIIIEFNTRLSRQFFPLFEQEYVSSPLEMLSELALGRLPNLQKKEIRCLGSSIPLRINDDSIVVSVPSKKSLETLEQELGIMSINIYVTEKSKLSDYRQDAYSFRYGVVDIAGKSLREIRMKEKKLMKKLKIIFKKV